MRSAGYRANSSCGGSWILGYVRRRDEIASEKNAAEARRTFPEGSRTIYFRSLGSTQRGQRSLGSSPPKSWLVPVRKKVRTAITKNQRAGLCSGAVSIVFYYSLTTESQPHDDADADDQHRVP